MLSIDPEVVTAMYLDGLTPKEIGEALCHSAKNRVREVLRRTGVLAPVFKAQHLAAWKNRQLQNCSTKPDGGASVVLLSCISPRE